MELLNELKALLLIKSPTGHTRKAIQTIEARFKKLGLQTQITNKGALIATLPGETEVAVTLSAHIDTLGCVVKEICSDGQLKLSQIGGYAWTTIEGEHVEIETHDEKFYTGQIITTVASSHVHGSKTNETKRSADTLRVRIDERVANAEDVRKLGIEIGDFVHLDPRPVISPSGFIKSRHLDDKACVLALIKIAEHFVSTKTKPKQTTHFFISNYEEVGHGAAAAIPQDSVELLALDMSAPGEGQTSDEFSVTICAKDSSGPYDYELKKRLIDLCQQQAIPYKVDIYPYYSSDGSAAQYAGHDLRVGLIGPGVDASHSYERTHIEAIESTIRLGIAYLEH